MDTCKLYLNYTRLVPCLRMISHIFFRLKECTLQSFLLFELIVLRHTRVFESGLEICLER